MDHGDTELAGSEGVGRMHGVLVEINLAFIGDIHTRKNVSQCALASAILADQRMATAALDFEPHAVQRQNAGEPLCDRAEGEKGHDC